MNRSRFRLISAAVVTTAGASKLLALGTTRVLVVLCCTFLILAASMSTASAQDSFVRVTISNHWGFVETHNITGTPAGASVLWQFDDPRATNLKQRRTTLAGDRFSAFMQRASSLGITNLEDYTQTDIEDGANYRFEGVVNGQSFDFTVYGVLGDLDDQRYFQILGHMKDKSKDVQIEEVPR